MMTPEQLDNWFTYHPPTEETTPKYAAIRAAEEAAHVAIAHVKRTAEQLRRQVEQQLALTGHYDPRRGAGAPRLQARLDAWLDVRRADLAPGTIHQYGIALRQFLVYAAAGANPGVLGLDALTREALAGFRGQLVLEGARPTTAQKRAEAVLGAWRWLDEGPDARWLPERPPRRLDGRRTRRAPGLDVPTWADLDALHGACVARYGAEDWRTRLAVLIRCTGLRRAEALLLRWDDVEPGRLTVRATKGDASARRVPVAPVLQAQLRGWERSGPWLVAAPPSERLAAVHGETTPGRMARGHADRDLRRAWETTGVRREVWSGRPCHCARRTWTTHLVAAGADRAACEYLIGHQPEGTGARWYADLETQLWPAMVAAVGMVPGLTISGARLLSLCEPPTTGR